MKFSKVICFFLTAFILFGCTATNNKSTFLPSGTPTPIPNPEPGKATVTGKMIKPDSTTTPISETLVRLAEIHGEGADSIYIFNDTESPGTYTDRNGVFVFTNIDPGPYAVLVMNENGDYLTINETEEKILTLNATVDKVVDLGLIRVDTMISQK